ncbi:glycoside hydrolase family 55 protein, partial [Planctomycetaceae bacterium]|nr:glycoside hydrolase family 55 protein [Planctomycetaceae bacterium]
MRTAKEFGAVGDGTTDDTAALEHAVQQADGVLHFPKGDYLIKKPITITLDRTGFSGISGEQGTARILMDASGP